MCQILKTERLILRDLRIDDIDDFFEYAKNPNVNSELSGWEPHFTNKEKAAAFLKSYAESNDTWAIVLRDSGKVIGHLKIYPDENRGQFSERNSAKLITYALSEDYWNKGYMTEAVKRVVKYVFNETGIELLTAFHVPHNIRSKRVIEKCGFQYETTIEQGFKSYNGQVYDSVIHSIMKSDYYATMKKLGVDHMNIKFTDVCFITNDVLRLRAFYEAVLILFSILDQWKLFVFVDFEVNAKNTIRQLPQKQVEQVKIYLSSSSFISSRNVLFPSISAEEHS